VRDNRKDICREVCTNSDYYQLRGVLCDCKKPIDVDVEIHEEFLMPLLLTLVTDELVIDNKKILFNNSNVSFGEVIDDSFVNNSVIVRPINISLVNVSTNVSLNMSNVSFGEVIDDSFVDDLFINQSLNVSANFSEENLTNEFIDDSTNEIIVQLTSLSGDLLMPVYDSYNSRVTSYFFGGSKLLFTKTSESAEFVHQDILGSNRLVSNISGGAVGYFKSLPFGQELINSANQTFTFSGKTFDEDYYYFNARYYDPDLGRFTSIDPIKENIRP